VYAGSFNPNYDKIDRNAVLSWLIVLLSLQLLESIEVTMATMPFPMVRTDLQSVA
jgi:hypothetical protein